MEKFRELERVHEISELVDPRPRDGGRLSYHGMPLLPICYECDWMSSHKALQLAVVEQMWFIGAEKQIC